VLSNQTRLPLYVQVKDYIADLIDSGKYPVDSRLPTENELMELLKVGRATVRAALAELEHEGRILKRHGIGTFVCEKENSYSFEPLVSLSYSLKKMGLDITNTTIISEMTLPAGDLLKGWSKDMPIGHLKRLRSAAGDPVAVEDSYFTPALYDAVTKLEPSQSIAHAILSYPDINISKVELCIVIRRPEQDERELLQLQDKKKVADMTRWIYRSGNATPVNYVKFVMPEELMGSAFLGKNGI
jgi:GntR family transcriptional regulator